MATNCNLWRAAFQSIVAATLRVFVQPGVRDTRCIAVWFRLSPFLNLNVFSVWFHLKNLLILFVFCADTGQRHDSWSHCRQERWRNFAGTHAPCSKSVCLFLFTCFSFLLLCWLLVLDTFAYMSLACLLCLFVIRLLSWASLHSLLPFPLSLSFSSFHLSAIALSLPLPPFSSTVYVNFLHCF